MISVKRFAAVVGIIGTYLAFVGACSDTTGSEDSDSDKADSAADSSRGDARSADPDTGSNGQPDGATRDGATDAGPNLDASTEDGPVGDGATEAGPDGDASIQDGAVSDADSAPDASDAPPDAAVPECGTKCGVDPRDPAVRCTDDAPTTPVAFPGDTVWANSLVQVSSEYDPDAWGGKQTLGAPNVYPAHVDSFHAWATENEDDANEFITVAFPANTTGVAVWIVATYSPDAVSSVVVTTASGDTTVYTNVAPASVGGCAYVLAVPTMTNLPIQSVTVKLASDLVPSHNEIDAIGIVP